MVTKHKKVPFHVIRFLYKTEWGRLWQALIDSHSTSACGLSWCRSPLPRVALSLNGGPISWKAARQGGVTLSSSEAEFVAASQAGKEILYLRALLKGLCCPQRQPTELWEDNASCILMSENPTNRERSRHVDVRVHFLRDMVRDGAVKLIKCAGTQNVADALTKSLPKPAFHKHREFLRVTSASFSAFYATAHATPVAAYVSHVRGEGCSSPKLMPGVPAGDDTHRFRGRAKYALGHSLCVKGFGGTSLVHLSTLNSW